MTIHPDSQIRYASLKAHAGRKKKIRDVPVAADRCFGTGVKKVYCRSDKTTQMLGDGDAKKGAAKLVEKLRTEVRVCNLSLRIAAFA